MKSSRRRRGFTLIEMLVVMGVIVLLMAMLFPAIKGALQSSQRNQAQAEVNALAAAIRAYQAEYGKLPLINAWQMIGANNEGEFYTGSTSGASQTIMKILEGQDTTYNPRQKVFIDPQPGSANGEFKDPWGRQYELKFDSNYTGKLEYYSGGNTAGSEKIPECVIVISLGPDGVMQRPDLGDDVVSTNYKDWVG